MLDVVRTEQTGRAVVVGVMLAAATVAVWLAVLPLRWTLHETGEPNMYSSTPPTSRLVLVSVVLAALAVAAGAAGHPLLPLLAVATPAFVLWCYQSATSEVIGANLWVVGAALLFPLLYGGTAVAGLIGYGLRRTLT